MSIPDEGRREAFIKWFFSEKTGNGIRLNDQEATVFLPWVDRMRGDGPKETVLPFYHRQTDQIIWYGIAFNDSQFYSLGQHLNHFIGASYSTFGQRRMQPSFCQEAERALNRISGGRFYRFEGHYHPILAKLELMFNVLQRSKGRKAELPRPIERVLRDFHMALVAGNRQQAEKELDYIGKNQYLTARNEMFLKVQMLRAFQEWKELVGLLHSTEILSIRRPLRVTGALIEAVYHEELATFENEGAERARRAKEYFGEEVWPKYNSLFGVRGYLNSPEVLKSFMLRAVAGYPTLPDLAKELVQSNQVKGHDLAYMRELAALIPSTGSSQDEVIDDALEHVRSLIRTGTYDRALSYLTPLPNSYDRTSLLFVCAYELQTLEANRLAYDAFRTLSAEDSILFMQSRRNREFAEELSNLGEPEADQPEGNIPYPHDWMSWIKQIELRGLKMGLSLAEKGHSEWDIEEMFQSDEDVNTFVSALHTCYEEPRKSVLMYALPHLIGFFQNDEQWPRREWTELYVELLQALLQTTDGNESDYAIFIDLSNALRESGFDERRYQVMMETAASLWKNSSEM